MRADKDAAPYLAGGKSEVTITWKHVAPTVGELPGFEVDCKGRVDFLADCGALVDLKTCRDGSPAGFGRAAFNMSMHTQAAFYRDGYAAATGRTLPYVIVAVETSAPFVVSVYPVPEAYLELGRDTYRAWLSRLATCRAENRWPGYVDGPTELQLPRWAAPNADEDVTGLDLDMEGAA